MFIDEDALMADKEENIDGAFDDDTDRLFDISASNALNLSTRQLTVKVERIIKYNVDPRDGYFHHSLQMIQSRYIMASVRIAMSRLRL